MLPAWARGAAAVAGAAALSVTLSACYGAPCIHEGGGGRGDDANLWLEENAPREARGPHHHDADGGRVEGAPADGDETPPDCTCEEGDGA